MAAGVLPDPNSSHYTGLPMCGLDRTPIDETQGAR